MVRLIAIALSLSVFIGSTDLHQVLRCPLVFSHYVYHAHEKPGLSASEFFSAHYNSVADTDGDREDDANLPFKNYLYDFSIQLPPVELPSAANGCIAIVSSLPQPAFCLQSPPEAPRRDIFEPPRAV